MKYAIIKDGGKQYQVSEGDKLMIERRNLKPGEEINFNEILLYADGDEVKVGAPIVQGITVKATVESEIKADKVTGIKFRKREGYRRKIGHRQRYTVLKITNIVT
jgi:large subunit ribosomal protein L21